MESLDIFTAMFKTKSFFLCLLFCVMSSVNACKVRGVEVKHIAMTRTGQFVHVATDADGDIEGFVGERRFFGPSAAMEIPRGRTVDGERRTFAGLEVRAPDDIRRSRAFLRGVPDEEDDDEL